MTRKKALETAECMKKSLDIGDIIKPQTQNITFEYSSYIDNTLNHILKPIDPKDMKVVIWGKELTSVAEWEDFLKIGKELKQENEQLKEQLERKMDLIGELDGYFEDIFAELDRNWREDKKWQGGMKGWYEEAIREIKELKQQLAEKDKEIEELKMSVLFEQEHKNKALDKLKEIRKQVCDEIREYIKTFKSIKADKYYYPIMQVPLHTFLNHIDQIEQVKESMK